MHEIDFDQETPATGRIGAGNDAKRRMQHNWITVVNPTNNQKLLQACDYCGVVKSENSVTRSCRAPRSQSLLMSSGDRLRSVS